jgi:hypothetical protein
MGFVSAVVCEAICGRTGTKVSEVIHDSRTPEANGERKPSSDQAFGRKASETEWRLSSEESVGYL